MDTLDNTCEGLWVSAGADVRSSLIQQANGALSLLSACVTEGLTERICVDAIEPDGFCFFRSVLAQLPDLGDYDHLVQ